MAKKKKRKLTDGQRKFLFAVGVLRAKKKGKGVVLDKDRSADVARGMTPLEKRLGRAISLAKKIEARQAKRVKQGRPVRNLLQNKKLRNVSGVLGVASVGLRHAREGGFKPGEHGLSRQQQRTRAKMLKELLNQKSSRRVLRRVK